MSTNNMMKESEEYLFEIKTSNFKIVLGQLVEHIENLSVEEDDEEDKNNIISLGEELIKQYEIINNKITSFKEDIENIGKSKLSLENKITKLNNFLNEADIELDNVRKKYEKEKEEHAINIKKLKDVSIRLQKTNEFTQELENTLKQKVDEVLYYKNKIAEDNKKQDKKIDINNETDYPPLDNINKNQSNSYIHKMNESNNKLLHQKTDKIKSLEKDLKDMYDQILDLQVIITKKDEYIKEIENNNSALNKEYSEKINNLKKSTTLESELLIIKYKEEINTLKEEISILKEEQCKKVRFKEENEEYLLNTIGNLKNPLLDDDKKYNKIDDKTDKCSLCIIF